MPRSILLVDDEPTIVRLLARFFECQGMETQHAHSAEEGIAPWEERHPDLVLLDLNLPGLSGLDALEVLVSRGATVIMLTGQAEVDVAVEAMQVCGAGFLTKTV